jgi:hypothetical protein
LSEGSEKNKPLHEHVASILPFRVLEAAEGKSLRIAGVAMVAGISRNRNVYTAEELQAFAPKLVGAPIYVEHVAVENGIGKVTKCIFDGQTKSLLYEAEIYDTAIAEKIRQGLIQHVSVGADYDALDTANVPHGLHNAEMSLVAVPGIPETNIHVLERLCESLASGKKRLHLSRKMREILEPLGPEFLQCVFCGQPGEYLVSLCAACGDNAQAAINGAQGKGNGVENMKEEDLKKLAEKVKAALEAGVSETEWDAEYINNLPDDAFAYIESGGQKDEQGKTTPRSLRHLPYKNAEGNLDADHVRNGLARLDQTEISADAKNAAMKKLCAAAGELKIESAVCNLDKTAEALQTKLTEAEGKLTTAEGKLAEANNTVEKLKALVPGVDLLKNPPKLMPVSEALERLGRCDLPKMQERLSLGNQLQAQKVRKEIFEVKQKYGVA